MLFQAAANQEQSNIDLNSVYFGIYKSQLLIHRKVGYLRLNEIILLKR
jgi:hypothetical protein